MPKESHESIFMQLHYGVVGSLPIYVQAYEEFLEKGVKIATTYNFDHCKLAAGKWSLQNKAEALLRCQSFPKLARPWL